MLVSQHLFFEHPSFSFVYPVKIEWRHQCLGDWYPRYGSISRRSVPLGSCCLCPPSSLRQLRCSIPSLPCKTLKHQSIVLIVLVVVFNNKITVNRQKLVLERDLLRGYGLSKTKHVPVRRFRLAQPGGNAQSTDQTTHVRT